LGGSLHCLASSALPALQPDQDAVREGAPFHFPVLIQLRAASVDPGPVIGHRESRPWGLPEESRFLLKGARREGPAVSDGEGEKLPLRTGL